MNISSCFCMVYIRTLIAKLCLWFYRKRHCNIPGMLIWWTAEPYTSCLCSFVPTFRWDGNDIVNNCAPGPIGRGKVFAGLPGNWSFEQSIRPNLRRPQTGWYSYNGWWGTQYVGYSTLIRGNFAHFSIFPRSISFLVDDKGYIMLLL